MDRGKNILTMYLSIVLLPNTKQTLVSLVDISKRKRLEETLQQTNKKLNLLNSITRHDINNQLTMLQGYLHIMEMEPSYPMNNGYFQKVKTVAERISSSIQFTQEYEKIGVTDPVWHNCHTLVDTAATQILFGDSIVKNDIPAGTKVFADPLIVKVFYNLMDNSVRYGGKITNIRFSLEDHDGEYIIVCEDDGIGIPTDEKEKIFERGFGQNTGLGLFISREILLITGLDIRETGVPDKGARFEITVPPGSFRI